MATTPDTPPAAPGTSDAVRERAAAVRTVTLITGDTVTLDADGTEPRQVEGPQGEGIAFEINKAGKDTYVYPHSALPYVSAGLLDKSLFNVTRLLADGYDDAHTNGLPLLVSFTDSSAARVRALPAGATKVRTLTSIRGAALTEERDRADAFWSGLTGEPGERGTERAAGASPTLAHGIAKVWLDGKVEAALADSTGQIGAPEVWAAGNTGKGVDVAVLDTGVDSGHPDLVDRIKSAVSFVPDESVFDDYVGHGTHVASTVAGTGAASDGREKGVAPGAVLHIGKVLATTCDVGGCGAQGKESWILAGMEWAARDRHAKIINMSLGGAPSSGDDPMSQAVNRLSAETGALFVISAGNSGAPSTVGSPGAADAALTVGAVNASDQLAGFSSQGPRAGDYGLKPELTAPGVDVLAARSHLSEGDGLYRTMSGTSMAAPHVAGAAALLAAAHPDWTGSMLKDALISTAAPTPKYTPYEAGAGRLDVAAAVRNTVFATGSAYSGYHLWPHPRGEKTDRSVTYTNIAPTPITLDLTVHAPNAPQGLFSLSTRMVTVPAHGAVDVTLTADLDQAPPDSHFSGVINAVGKDGKAVAHTLVGVGKEAERYNLSVTAKDRGGKPLSGVLTVAARNYFHQYTLGESGTSAVRLPVGTYALWLDADVQGTHGPHSLGKAMLSVPEIRLDRDRHVVLDATEARQVSAVVPKKTTDSEVRMDLYRSFDSDHYTLGTLDPGTPGYDSMWVLPTGKKVTKGEFAFGARWRKEEPALTVDAGGVGFDDLRVQRGGTPLPDGRTTLAPVLAGQGAAADYAGLDARGKAAVVLRSDAATVEEQASAAAQAGARLLLVVNDGSGRLEPWPTGVQSFATPPPVTVATLTRDGGEELMARIRRGRTPLTLHASRVTDYLYDLVRRYEGSIPADPTYRPDTDDLARVDVSFRNHRQARASDYRSDIWEGVAMGASFLHEVPAQGHRTDWVSADTDTPWLERVQIPGEVQESSAAVRYRAGSTTDLHWFGPIHRPRLDNRTGVQQRTDDAFYVNVPGWGDSGGGHVGSTLGNPGVDNMVSLYQGDTLLTQEYSDYVAFAGLNPDPLAYRLVSENARGYWTNPYSTSTRTEWGFTSAADVPGKATVLPLIQLDYGVDTDPEGKARRNATLLVTPSHLPGGPSSKDIRALTLDISYDDGTTWQKTSLTRRGDSWETRLHASSRASYATLRTSAHDRRGNSVTQKITRAFGLK
ncbi:S8 family serine peptidase [Streptomyces sp. NBC_00178]|uniref:S8 family serine peptidase n=1 Tax=Streptomyces sp. NBC_00178 TaxID=2975672 RepID=UPI002E2BC6E8|nr:S8 family serine peptidase [Streptomyces sp. NBC_00178]